MFAEIIGGYRACGPVICKRRGSGGGVSDGDDIHEEIPPHMHPHPFPFDFQLVHLQVYHHH